jgi:hypothetical protein
VCGLALKPELSSINMDYLMGYMNSKAARWYFPRLSHGLKAFIHSRTQLNRSAPWATVRRLRGQHGRVLMQLAFACT